jgi:hypothetical protein
MVAVGHHHGPPAQHVGGTDHHRVPDAARDHRRLFQVHAGVALRLAQAQLVQQLAAALAVLRDVDAVRRGAQDLAARLEQRHGQVQRGLPAHLHHDALRLLVLVDVHHIFEGERLEVELVRGVVVGGHRLGLLLTMMAS